MANGNGRADREPSGFLAPGGRRLRSGRGGLAARAGPGPRRPTAHRTSGLPHFRPKATRVIYLFMHGGPSHLETFDPKPDLQRLAGQPLPASFGPVATRRQGGAQPAARHASGRSASAARAASRSPTSCPTSPSCADDLAVIRSCWADSVNHPQAVYQINTGSILMGKPSLGSWVSYGLGTENQDLPAFVVLPDPGGGIKGGPPAYGAGFLPASHQGTADARRRPSPILDLQPPDGSTARRPAADARPDRPAQRPPPRRRGATTPSWRRASRAYELAFRMQSAAPEAVDLASETAETKPLYGLDDRRDGRVRHPLPAGPAAGRARRPVRPALLGRRQRLGRPRRRRDEPRARCAPDRQAGRRPAQGPEAARAAREHAGDLGRRVRPDADVRERQGPRPQPARLLPTGWPAAGSRGARSTARPTPSASAPRSIASTCTTCTRPSSTCSASTTPGSPSCTTAATTA